MTQLLMAWNDVLSESNLLSQVGIVVDEPISPRQFAFRVLWIGVFWWCVFRALIGLFPKTNPEVFVRILGLTYTSCTALLATHHLLTNTALHEQLARLFVHGDRTFDVMNLFCSINSFLSPHLVGSLLFEMAAMPYYSSFKAQRLMIVHHLIPIVAFPILTCQVIAHPCMVYWHATELSTPFLQMRWLLEYRSLKSSPVYAINGLLLALVFFIIRVIPIPFYALIRYFSWPLLMQRNKIAIALGSLDIISCSLNLYWGFLIARGLLKFLIVNGGDSSKKHSVSEVSSTSSNEKED